MKTLWQNFSHAILAALSALALVALPAYADDGSAGPLSIQAFLVTPTHITLGEPILVRYKIANNSGQGVAAQLGIYGTDWYTLTMRDAGGAAVPAIPDLRPKYPQGSHPSQNRFFHDRETSTEYIPITKWLPIQRPGQYTLTIHVHLRYAVDDTTAEGASAALLAGSGLAQTQDITFPILVVPADSIRLRDIAEALRKASVNGLDGQLARAEMDLLFSMPEAQAATSWRSLAMKPTMFTEAVVGELADLHSARGADILAEMLDDPALSRSSINVSLNRLYNTSTPALREHIRILARKRGFEMPNVASTPLVDPEPGVSRGGTAF